MHISHARSKDTRASAVDDMKQARSDEDNGLDRFGWEESYLESKTVCSMRDYVAGR